MSLSVVRSRCECEAALFAEVDSHFAVVRGWARSMEGTEEPAPANALHVAEGRFDVGWACPICTRNTLRSFDLRALVRPDAP